jgi:hypothetical protein
VRIHAQSLNGRRLFIGIAPTAAVSGYLGNVGRSELTGFSHGDAQFAEHLGTSPDGPPSAQLFWARTATGRGDIALTWPVRHGAWTVVVMNANAMPGIAADVRLGARLDFLGELAGGIAVVALLSGAFATWLALAGIRRVNRANEAV